MNDLRFLRSARFNNALKVASVALGLTFGFGVIPAYASTDSNHEQGVDKAQSLTAAQKNEIASKFMAYFPQIKVVEVSETVFEGMFELSLDSGESVFVNKDANHLLVNAKHLKVTGPGQIVDISEQRKSDGRKALLASLNTDDAVIFKGEGKNTTPLYVFTDVDCGYCRKLHEEVPALQKAGIDVMYFAWPRAGMQSNTASKMKQVWCADDQQSAMTAAKTGQPLPEEKSNCNPPIEADFKAGVKLGVAGTPAIFLEDGRQIGGYAKAEDLLKVINAK